MPLYIAKIQLINPETCQWEDVPLANLELVSDGTIEITLPVAGQLGAGSDNDHVILDEVV